MVTPLCSERYIYRRRQVMSVKTKKVTLAITYDSDVWPDPVTWDWSDLVGDVWHGPTEGRTVSLAAMHLDDTQVPWGGDDA